MMKYPKKIISLCLVFVMTTSMAAHTTFASSLANSVEPVTTDICILNDDPLNYTVLKSEDFLNGDIIFTLIQNDITIETCYVNRSQSKITSVDQHGKHSTFYYVPESKNTMLVATPYTYLGAIEYQFSDLSYLPQTGTALVWNSVSTNYSGSYNVNGTYQNVTQLVSYLVTLFGFPGAIISRIAQYILWAAGVTVGTISFFIPDLYVSAVEKTSLWRVADNSYPSYYYYDEGTEYTLTAEGYEGRVYTDGSFHDPLEFRGRNGALATDIFALVWPGYIFHQVSEWYII